MQNQIDIDEALELLDELILKPTLDHREQEALRFTAMLQVIAYAATLPGLAAEDHKLLALLLGRWGFALTDHHESELDGLTDAYPVEVASLAPVCDCTPAAVEDTLKRLVDADLIGLEPPEDGSAGAYRISFSAVLGRLAPSLYELLLAEFIAREGCELGKNATDYIEAIGADINDLAEHRAIDPQVHVLQRDYRAFAVRISTADLMVRWLDAPQVVYDWLDDLAALQERCAILGGSPVTDLRRDLASRLDKKVMILRRRLEPSPPAANAA